MYSALKQKPLFFQINNPWIVETILIGTIIAIFLILGLWNIQGELPFNAKPDEEIFVNNAAIMAATGDYNPHWFGNPGSTVIYPLAGIYKLKNSAASPLAPSDFYLFGRFLSLFYAVLTIPLVYSIGASIYGKKVGFVAAWFMSFYPIFITHSQIVRTDTAGTFFYYLSIWLMLRLRNSPTIKNYLLTGAAIGLATVSRYFMAILLVLLIVHQLIYFNGRDARSWRKTIIGIFSAILVFAITTPYFFIDFHTSLKNLAAEARGLHPGADGLSQIGNFFWYVFKAIPWSISWPQSILAIVGIWLTLRRRDKAQILLLSFLTIYLIGISALSLHWQRWIIPLLPGLALLAAYALITLAEYLLAYLRVQTNTRWLWILSIVILITLPLLQDILVIKKMETKKSNLLQAQEWIQNSLLSQHLKTSKNASFKTLYFMLDPKADIDRYKERGYRYIIVNDNIRQIAEATPERYPVLLVFYKDLDARGLLINTFDEKITCPLSFGAPFCNSPSIKIYDLLPTD